MAKLWLYRTSETDDMDDPYDFGVARATTREEAAAFVEARLVDILGTVYPYFLYELNDDGANGVINS